MNKIKIFYITVLTLFFILNLISSGISFAKNQIELEFSELLELKKEILNPDKLIGVRTFQDKIYLADENKIIKLDIAKLNNSYIETILYATDSRIIDFAITKNYLVYINENGLLHTISDTDYNFNVGPYDACRIETSNDNLLILLGGRKSYIFPVIQDKPASEPITISDIQPCYPLDNGFIATIDIHRITYVWSLELLEQFGNKIKRLYKFDRKFKPNAFNFIAVNSDREILISYILDNKRYVSLITANGRMAWSINLEKPICLRDIGFLPDGKLLLVDKSQNANIILKKVSFSKPAG